MNTTYLRNGPNLPADEDGMADLSSLPASVRQAFQQAQADLAGARNDVEIMMRAAAVELARQQPELLIALFALSMGKSQVIREQQHDYITTVTEEHSLFGIRFGCKVTTTRNQHTDRHIIGFG